MFWFVVLITITEEGDGGGEVEGSSFYFTFKGHIFNL